MLNLITLLCQKKKKRTSWRICQGYQKLIRNSMGKGGRNVFAITIGFSIILFFASYFSKKYLSINFDYLYFIGTCFSIGTGAWVFNLDETSMIRSSIFIIAGMLFYQLPIYMCAEYFLKGAFKFNSFILALFISFATSLIYTTWRYCKSR